MGGSPYDSGKIEPYPKREYNSDGKITSIVLNKAGTMWVEFMYDKDGNEVLKHTSDKYWYRKEYNASGQLTYFYNSQGDWYQYDFDENNRITAYKHSNGEYIDVKYICFDMVEYIDSAGIWYKNYPGIMYEDYNGNYWNEEMGMDNPYPSITKFVKNAISELINDIERGELILSMTEELNNQNAW